MEKHTADVEVYWSGLPTKITLKVRSWLSEKVAKKTKQEKTKNPGHKFKALQLLFGSVKISVHDPALVKRLANIYEIIHKPVLKLT